MNTEPLALLDKYFDLAITAPDGIKRLRETILTLAMQGKLVPQDPTDPPASELLKEIEAEKKRLVKEGKLKKTKQLPPIKTEEVPYQLPESWEWVRLGMVSSYIQRGKGPRYSEEKKIPVISQKCIQWSGFDESVVKYVDPESISDYSDERFIQNNDLLWNSTGTGTIGRIGIYQDELSDYSKIVADSHVTVIRVMFLDATYILQFLKTPLIQNAIYSMASGTTNQIELNTSTVIEQIIPLPPLPEQCRIVAKIDELMARVDELERKRDARNERRIAMHQAAVARLLDAGDAGASREGRDFIFAHFADLYGTKENVAELRKAILQLAVMGRLVPQDPKDPPASELLKEIEEEKKRLVQEGTIKEPKPLPPIKPEEVPYQLPESWEFCVLGNIASLITKGSTPTSYGFSFLTTGIPFVKVENVKNGSIQFNDKMQFISNEAHAFQKRSQLMQDDILFSIAGTIGETCVVKASDIPSNINQALAIIRGYKAAFTPAFLIKCLNSSVASKVKDKARGGAMYNISLGDISNMIIPIPPLPEQQRIVAKVDELMSLCDQLEKKIDERTAKETALLEAVAARV